MAGNPDRYEIGLDPDEPDDLLIGDGESRVFFIRCPKQNLVHVQELVRLANANPDLLAACKLALSMNPNGVFDENEPEGQQLRAAISRAEGR